MANSIELNNIFSSKYHAFYLYNPLLNRIGFQQMSLVGPDEISLIRQEGRNSVMMEECILSDDHSIIISPFITRIPSFITLDGLPATTELLGTSFVTTAPAPTITSSPTWTPGKIILYYLCLLHNLAQYTCPYERSDMSHATKQMLLSKQLFYHLYEFLFGMFYQYAHLVQFLHLLLYPSSLPCVNILDIHL